jgi:hypothetical protein
MRAPLGLMSSLRLAASTFAVNGEAAGALLLARSLSGPVLCRPKQYIWAPADASIE